jgi:peptide chain release factor 3
MEIEKQRGISVATSVMSFHYADRIINILDTPGHKDFAEDTYRTLTAVDSVIMVVDSVKGVEEQTRRLMEVCAMRKTPVIVFINKLDREGQDPFELLEEIEKELKIKTRPLTWPINRGSSFKGVYNLHRKTLNLFRPSTQKMADEVISLDLNDSQLETIVGDKDAAKIREDVELIEAVFEPFDTTDYLKGDVAPVFFWLCSQ